MIDEKVLIERLEKLQTDAIDKWDGGASHRTYSKSIEIVKQLAEEQKEKLMLKNCIDGQEIEPCGRPRVYMGMEDLIELEAYRDFGTLHQIRALNDRYHQLIEERLNNGWIPCSERLPEENGKYLVCVDNPTRNRKNCIFAFWFNAYDKEFEREHDLDYVIAWQPLPAPYQPKGEQ